MRAWRLKFLSRAESVTHRIALMKADTRI